MALRQFLYLDVPLVDQFLSQLEDGVAGEVRYATTEATEGGTSGSINVGFARAGGDVKGRSEMVGETIYAVPPTARFNRLHKILEAPVLDEDDEDLSDRLALKEIVEIECSIEIAQLSKISQNAEGLSALGMMAEQFGVAQDSGVSKVFDQIKVFSSFFKENIFVATTTLDQDERGGRPALLFRMDRQHVVRDLSEVEGDVTILGRVNKTWKEGEPVSLYTLPGVSALPRAKRREFERSQQGNDSLATTGPAISMDTIAVYT